jgi:hypothetical protein
MTSIAIISQHPLRAGASSSRSAGPAAAASAAAAAAHGGHDPRVDLELTLCNLERRRAGKDSSWNWDRFYET